MFAVSLNNFRAGRIQAAAQHEPVAPATERIEQGLIGEREQIGLPSRVLRVPRIAPIKTEAIVRCDAPPACDMRHQSVKYQTTGEIFVEAEVEKIAKEAAGLRHTESDGTLNGTAPTCRKRIGFCAIAAQKRGHVARGSEAEAERDWVARCGGHLVQRSRIKASRGTNDRDGLRASRTDGEPGRLFSGRIPLRTHRHHYR